MGINPLQLVLDQPYILTAAAAWILPTLGAHWRDRLADRDLKKSGASDKARARAARDRHDARVRAQNLRWWHRRPPE